MVRDVPVDEAGTTYGALIQQKYPEITEFNHIHHAGNSSGVVDGAAALLAGLRGLHGKKRHDAAGTDCRHSKHGRLPHADVKRAGAGGRESSDESRTHQR